MWYLFDGKVWIRICGCEVCGVVLIILVVGFLYILLLWNGGCLGCVLM